MSSARISRILDKAKEVYDDTHQQWLDSDAIGVNVKLFYPSTWEDCINCEFDQFGGICYKTGGPIGFTLSGCPVCGTSTALKEVEATEIIKLRVYSVDSTSFSRSTFKKLGVSIDQPQGELLTIGFLDDVPKIKSSNYALFYIDQESSIGSIRYKISTDPQPHGFGKDKFFFCFWNRV